MCKEHRSLTIACPSIGGERVSSPTAAGVGADFVVTDLSTLVGAFNTLIDVCVNNSYDSKQTVQNQHSEGTQLIANE